MRSKGLRIHAVIAAVSGAALAGACEPSPRTEVMVTIEAEPMVRARARQVIVSVYGAASDSELGSEPVYEYPFATPLEAATFHVVVALAPANGDSSRRYRVEAAAYETPTDELDPADRPDPIARVRVIGGYVEGRTLHLPLVLQDSCIELLCAETDRTCKDGMCEDARRDGLSPWTGRDAGSVDGGARDAGRADSGGTDAGAADAGRTDAGDVDAGTDAGATDGGSTDAGADSGTTCDAAVAQPEDTVGTCNDGSDNDCDGARDCEDPSCDGMPCSSGRTCSGRTCT